MRLHKVANELQIIANRYEANVRLIFLSSVLKDVLLGSLIS